MTRKSHEQFVSDLAAANPSVRPLGAYVHSKEHLEVECLVCGNRWSATPNMLLRGSGCPECARKHLGDARRKSNEQFIAELPLANPNAEPLGTYVNCSTPIDVRCRACGTVWKSKPASLLKGVLCPSCRHERKKHARMKSHGDFLRDMEERHPEIEVLGRYEGNKVGVACMCLKCGFEWNPRPNDLLDGHGCPKCGGSHYKTHEEYVKELRHKFPNLEVIGRYVSDSKRIRVRCRVCGHERQAIANSLLRQNEGGANCPNCAGTKKLTQEEFAARLAKISPDITIIGEYRNMDTGVEVECGLCGHRWSPTAASLVHAKSGCPKCHHGATSVMEQFIYQAFTYMLGSDAVLSRDRSLGIELDVYIPELKLAVEPGSWFWHEGKLADDEGKRKTCESRGIRLITLYDQCPLEEPPFGANCLVYDYPLASEKGMTTLKSFVCKIMEEYALDADFTDEDWEAVGRRARLSSRRMTTKEFKERLMAVSPSIEPLSDYIDSKTRVHCRCRDCGHEWRTAPGNLLHQRTKCPHCAHRKKSIDRVPATMGADEFIESLASVNPGIELIGGFYGLSERSDFRCAVCGREWTASPRVLLAGSGCPSCRKALGGKEGKATRRLALEKERVVLEERLGELSWSISLVGEYGGKGKLVTARCSKCGHEWRAKPERLLKAHRCPRCERKRGEGGFKTDEQFRSEVAEKYPDIEIVGEYRGVHEHVEVRCRECGREWKTTPNRILRGCGCRSCKLKGPRKTTAQFVEELGELNGNVLVKSEYRGTREKVLVECLACGHEWETDAAHLLSGTGCPECAKVKQGATNRKSHSQFVEEIAEKSPSVQILGTYAKKSSRIQCRCRTCGHVWETSGQSLIQGSKCPVCAGRKSSASQKGVRVKDRMRRVRCVETGEEFASATAASHSMGLGDPCVGRAAKTGGTSGGFHWVFI